MWTIFPHRFIAFFDTQLVQVKWSRAYKFDWKRIAAIQILYSFNTQNTQFVNEHWVGGVFCVCVLSLLCSCSAKSRSICDILKINGDIYSMLEMLYCIISRYHPIYCNIDGFFFCVPVCQNEWLFRICIFYIHSIHRSKPWLMSSWFIGEYVEKIEFKETPLTYGLLCDSICGCIPPAV